VSNSKIMRECAGRSVRRSEEEPGCGQAVTSRVRLGLQNDSLAGEVFELAGQAALALLSVDPRVDSHRHDGQPHPKDHRRIHPYLARALAASLADYGSETPPSESLRSLHQVWSAADRSTGKAATNR
jgi:hypothetical protein